LPRSELATYRIGTAARLTGLSEHLIRVWERRYRAVQPRRTASGVRLYSEADLTRLRLLRRVTDQGHAIGSVAGLDTKHLRRLGGDAVPVTLKAASTPSAAPRFVEQILKAVAALDPGAAQEAISRSDAALGLRTTALDVLLPALQEVGRRWETGHFSVAQEHAAASMVRDYLGAALRNLGHNERSALALSATLAGELHEFGALAAAVYAASSGLGVIYLGPNLPSADLVRAALTLRARILLLSAVATTRGLESRLAELRADLPARVRIVVGGAAAERLKQLPPNVVGLQRIEQLGSVFAQLRQSPA
jgi:DNA-binding transcriptional MerR regulator